MKMDVYFFSGTGNSLYIAKKIIEEAEGRAIPITSVINKESITPDADVFGIIFPVYYADIPLIIKRFAKKLSNIENKYIFAVSNYGGSTGTSFSSLDNILIEKGGKLSSAFGIHMPQNAFRKVWENYERIYRKCRKRIGFIIKKIQEKKTWNISFKCNIRMANKPFSWIS